MVKDYRGGGPEIYWGDVPVGDFDLRYFCKSAPGLFIGEWKWRDDEIERDAGQRVIYTDIVKLFHPYLWIVYITGMVMPDNQGRLLAQCERFRRLMPDGALHEIDVPNLPMRGDNLKYFLPYFETKCREEILAQVIKKAANDNIRIVPDYGKKLGNKRVI